MLTSIPIDHAGAVEKLRWSAPDIRRIVDRPARDRWNRGEITATLSNAQSAAATTTRRFQENRWRYSPGWKVLAAREGAIASRALFESGDCVLVTGGAGFIGSHVVARLLSVGARVRVLDDFSTGCEENLRQAAQAELLTGDIRDAAVCRRACRGVHHVVHLAALGSVPRSLADPASTMGVNVAGTANVLAASRDAGVARVVYASSSSVYGDDPRLPKREGEEGQALSPYALSKRMSEELAGMFGRVFALPSIGLRFFNVYGPRQSPDGPYAAVIPRFLAAARAAQPMEIHGDGLQSRDFTYVDDAVTAVMLALAAPLDACGRAYNIAGGQRVTIDELARDVAHVAASEVAPRHLAPRAGDVPHSWADLGAAAAALGYAPGFPLAEGLRQTWNALLVESGSVAGA